MAEEDISGIALGLSLDTAGFSSGVARAKAELEGLKSAARSIEIGVTSRARQTGSNAHDVTIPGGAPAQPRISPQFQVSKGAVRDLRTDINAQMRQFSSQGEGVGVGIKLGRVPYAAIRNEISQGIGEVPIRVVVEQKSIAAAARSITNAVISGPGAPAGGIPRRAAGGSAERGRPMIVGEHRAEVFWPTENGRIGPNVPHAERGARTAFGRLSSQELDYHGNLSAAARRLQPHHVSGGKEWYDVAGAYGKAKSREHGIPERTGVGVLAALSAGTSWEANKTKFERILKAHSAGKDFPYSMKLDAHRKAAAILGGLDPAEAFKTSPKVGQFFPGMMGDLSTLTIDRWAARTATRGKIDQPGSGKQRKLMDAAYRDVAKQHGMAPAQFQAALWLLEKEESSQSPGQIGMGFARGGFVHRAGGGPVGGGCQHTGCERLAGHVGPHVAGYSAKTLDAEDARYENVAGWRWRDRSADRDEAESIRRRQQQRQQALAVRPDQRDQISKLKAMATQTTQSPNEAAIARRMLHERGIEGYARGGAMRGAGFVPGLRSVAQAYNRSVGMPRIQEHILHPLDVDFSKRTAKAYEAMPVGPDALSRKAYHAFGEETDAQYEFLQRAGFQFDPDPGDPYHPTARHTKMQLAAQDVRKNKRLLAFSSALEHPLLTNEQNLKFRHVHDMMGHLTEGFSIGPRGEFNAAVKHSQMFSPLARMAMLAETHGQNSVVNFSDVRMPDHDNRTIAEINKEAPGTIYAQQKAQILPKHILDEFYMRTGIKRAAGGPAGPLSHVPKNWQFRPDRGLSMASEGQIDDIRREKLENLLIFNPRKEVDSLIHHEIGTSTEVGGRAANLAMAGKNPYLGNVDVHNHPLQSGIEVPRPSGADIRNLLVSGSSESRVVTPNWTTRMRRATGAGFSHAGWTKALRSVLDPTLRNFGYAGVNDFVDQYTEEGEGSRRANEFYDDLYSQMGDKLGFSLERERRARGGVAKGQMGMLFRTKSRTFKPFCSVCGTSVQNASTHPSTEKHRANLRGRSQGTGDWLKSRGGNWRATFNEDALDAHYETDYRARHDPALDPEWWGERDHMAAGGKPGHGLYVVNEIGRELFVPKGKESHIPAAVAAELPGGGGLAARLARAQQPAVEPWKPVWMRNLAAKDMTERASGGMVEIPGHGPRLWQAPEDGWIIPNRLMNKVPRKAGGGATFAGGGFDSDEYRNSLQTPSQDEEAPAKPLRRRAMRTGDVGLEPDQGRIYSYDPEVYAEEERKREAAAARDRELALAAATHRTASERREEDAREAGRRLDALGSPSPTLRPVSSTIYDPERDSGPVAPRRGSPRGDYHRELRGVEATRIRASRAASRSILASSREVTDPIADAYASERGGRPYDVRGAQARARSAANTARTGRSAIGGIAGFFLGGGQGRQTALAEARSYRADYQRMLPKGFAAGTDTLEALQHVMHDLDGESQHLTKTFESGKLTSRDYRTEIARVDKLREQTTVKIKQAGDAQERESAALSKATGGAARNFASVTAAGFAFNIGMQVVSKGIEYATQVAAPFVDQLGGFVATSQKVTQDLAGKLPAAGTPATLFAQTAQDAGLSGANADVLQRDLGPSVLAKAGATKSGQIGDLIKATFGSGSAPTGLIGGYGGLFGTPVLGEQLGGGKGLLEQIAQQVSTSRSGPAQPQSWTNGQLGVGIGAAGGFGRNAIRDLLGPGQGQLGYGLLGGQEDPLHPVVPVTQAQRDAQRLSLSAYNDATARAQSPGNVLNGGGQGGGTLVEDAAAAAAIVDPLKAEFGTDAEKFAQQMAAVGVVFKDSAGATINSTEGLNKAVSVITQGLAIPDQAAYAKAHAQQLVTGEQTSAIQGQFQRDTAIPGQLGQQVYANPFGSVTAGIEKGFKPVIADLGQTAALQKTIQQQADAGIAMQARRISENVGAPEAATFTADMGAVQNYGNRIAAINDQLANKQAAVGALQYANSIRILTRNIRDARGLAGMSGGSQLGGIERQQYTLGRQSQQLGFESQGLSLAMNQRQINFQTAVAGFQAPGLSSEERTARIHEAEIEAAYAQKQQNISVAQLGIGKQQFGLEGQAFGITSGQSVQDLQAQRAILEQSHSLEQEQVAAQKRINALTILQGQKQAEAQSLFAQATNNFDARLGAAAQYAGLFGGTMASAIKAVTMAIANAPGQTGSTGTESHPGKQADDRVHGATGLAVMTHGPTNFLAGEVKDEAVLIVKNPSMGRLPAMAPPSQSGGGQTIQIIVTGNTIKDEGTIDDLVRKVEAAIMRRGATMGLRPTG